jgi:hypothetical protein
MVPDSGNPSTVRLFQYGSNMHPVQFADRVARHSARYAPPDTPLDLRLLGPAPGYVGLREAVDRCERAFPDRGCSDEYANAVLFGARSAGLPTGYIARAARILGCA